MNVLGHLFVFVVKFTKQKFMYTFNDFLLKTNEIEFKSALEPSDTASLDSLTFQPIRRAKKQ